MSMTERLNRSRRRSSLISQLRTKLRNARQDRDRALKRLERSGEKKRGPDGDAALAHAEGRLRGYELAEKLADELEEATDSARL